MNVADNPKMQFCFPLYVAAKEVIRFYKPYLDKLDLTYTQYIVMMILWEKKTTTSKELGKRLFLDCGTLTPLLRKLENKGYITRNKDPEDNRNLIVTITNKGKRLETKAVDFPMMLDEKSRLTCEEKQVLRKILYKIIDTIE